jgi:trigger factor
LKSVNKTEEEVHEEFHEAAHDTAIERIKKSLVLGKISDEEKIPITDADIDADIERMLQNITGQNRDDLAKSLNRQEVRESINQRLLARKLMDKLVEIAKGPAIEAKTDKEESKE